MCYRILRLRGAAELARTLPNGEIAVRIIESYEDLRIPRTHEVYLERLIDYFKTYPKIERVLLFGSCAIGEATQRSDMDLFLIGSDLTDDDEWEIAWNCPKLDEAEYISCDILSGTHESYERMSKVPGMVQYAIELRGVDISGLLQAR